MEIDLDQLRSADPLTRAKRAHEALTDAQVYIARLSRMRRDALHELRDQGTKQADLARLLDVSAQRLGTILKGGPSPASALLGTGDLTVAIGGKHENGRSNPSAVISAEALAAYHAIKALAEGYGMAADYELVPPPGLVNLNRTNLVVLTSPRLLPIVGQVLESDPHVGFQQGSRGWYLVDRAEGKKYRSPSDSGEPADYAYVGRLPRPDQKGTFLYVAGVHAMGTLGAAQWLVDNIERLYREVKTRRWSVLVSCSYDPDTREITTTDRLTPLYTV